MLQKLKDFLIYWNESGVPVPLVRNPMTDKGDLAMSMVVISFGLCTLGIIGKWSSFLGGVDLTQALLLLSVSCSLFFGKSLIKTGNDFTINNKESSKNEST